MSNSVELSDLVARHLQGKVDVGVIIEFNQLILKMRKGESTIHGAIDKFFGGNPVDEIDSMKRGLRK